MPRILIVGYGNPLRGDDGLAWWVIEELSREGLPDDVEVIVQHQLTPELALSVSRAARVLFIDASRVGTPGNITSESVKAQPLKSTFSHEFSPATILSLVEQLYGKCPEATIISLCGENFDHGELLSPKVKAGLPRLMDLIREQIKSPSVLAR